MYLPVSGVSGGTVVCSDSNGTTTLNSSSGYSPFVAKINGTESMRLDSSGNLLVGTTSTPAASAKVKIATATRSAAFFDLNATGGENWIIDSTNTTSSTDVLGIYAYGSTGMYLTDTGNLLVGTTSGSYKITCNGQPGANGYTAWTNYSDSRLKENIVDFNGGLSDVMQIRPVTFNYNELSGYDESTRARKISGFIAQELMEVRPEMVGVTTIGDIEYYDTNTSDLNLLLVKAVQEQQVIIESLTERIAALEGGK